MPNIGTFGIQTIGAASQPVFGTTLSAATKIAPDQFTGNTGPSSQPSISYLTLTNPIGFIPGYRIVVAPKNHFEQYVSWGFQDSGTILSISGSVIKVQGLTMQHASGDYVLVAEDASEVEIVPIAASAIMYIGLYSTVSAIDPGVFDVIPALASGAPTYWHQSREGTGGNTYKTSEFWIAGTNGNTFVARFTQT